MLCPGDTGNSTQRVKQNLRFAERQKETCAKRLISLRTDTHPCKHSTKRKISWRGNLVRIDIACVTSDDPGVIAGFVYTDLDGTATEEELTEAAFADMQEDYAGHTVSAGLSEESSDTALVVEVFAPAQPALAAIA